MSETEDRRLYGLLEIAEQQQAAVQMALEGLAAERAALQREREMLGREMQGLNRNVRAAVLGAVAESMHGAAETGASALKVAMAPLLGRLDQVSTTAGQADATLRRVVLWASWRLLGWVVGACALFIGLAVMTSSGVLWWDARTIGEAQSNKLQLEATVAELQANYDNWIKAGMLQNLMRCEPGNRPCVRLDEHAGKFGANGDIRVIQGY